MDILLDKRLNKWVRNTRRFKTYDEAEAFGQDLSRRWSRRRKTRVSLTSDPITHVFADGIAVPVPPPSKA